MKISKKEGIKNQLDLQLSGSLFVFGAELFLYFLLVVLADYFEGAQELVPYCFHLFVASEVLGEVVAIHRVDDLQCLEWCWLH